jgi:hypothetical protein
MPDIDQLAADIHGAHGALFSPKDSAALARVIALFIDAALEERLAGAAPSASSMSSAPSSLGS